MIHNLHLILTIESALALIATLRDADPGFDFERNWCELNEYRQRAMEELTPEQDIKLEFARRDLGRELTGN